MKLEFYFLFSAMLTMFVARAQSLPDPLPSPVQSGSYLPGILGVRDYSNPGFSGVIAVDYNIYINSNRYIDRFGEEVDFLDFPELGDPIPIEVDINGYINSLMLVYVSPKLSFLNNVQYMFIVAPSYATANARLGLGELVNEREIEGGTSGFGDLVVAPLFLSWGAENQKFDLTGGYMFAAPTGRYQTGADDNTGLGYWSHIFQIASYYYPMPDKAMAILVAPAFELHSETKDVEVKAGSRLALDYGISQYVSERLEATLQGGHIWQIGEDSGEDVYWDTSVKDRMSVFGLGLGYWPVAQKLYTHLKWTTSYANRQQFKLNMVQLEIMYIPLAK